MSLAEAEGIDDPSLYNLLFHLAASVAESGGDTPVFISISGSQGSGKTSLAELFKVTFSQCFSRPSLVLSLDDFYLPRKERRSLADAVHPMLAVRGVPGTHDVAWLAKAMQCLAQRRACDAPVFDKARDDRLARTRRLAPSDLVIVEGWCWGATAQTEEALSPPVNNLEQTRDKEGTWRRYVNDNLGQEYQQIFAPEPPLDLQIFIKAPSMDAVYRWRLQQEQQLVKRDSTDSSSLDDATKQEMDAQAIREFIAHYERLTLWMLDDMPGRADLVIELAESHRISRVQINTDCV